MVHKLTLIIWLVFVAPVVLAQTLTDTEVLRLQYPTSDRSYLDTQRTRDVLLDSDEITANGYFTSQLYDDDADGVANIDDNCPDSSGKYPVDSCGCDLDVCPRQPIADGYCAPDKYLRFFDIVFDLDEKQLTPHSHNQLRLLANEMLRDTDAYLTVFGHTDSWASHAYNVKLGMSRADKALEVLLRAGIPEERIQIATLGEDWPAYDNNFYLGRANNRRDDMSLGWINSVSADAPPKYFNVAGCGRVRALCKPVAQSYPEDVSLTDTIYFEEDERAISEKSMSTLRRLAKLAYHRQDIHFVISGLQVEWKTLQVMKRLIIKGVSPQRLHLLPPNTQKKHPHVVVSVMSEAPAYTPRVPVLLD